MGNKLIKLYDKIFNTAVFAKKSCNCVTLINKAKETLDNTTSLYTSEQVNFKV